MRIRPPKWDHLITALCGPRRSWAPKRPPHRSEEGFGQPAVRRPNEAEEREGEQEAAEQGEGGLWAPVPGPDGGERTQCLGCGVVSGWSKTAGEMTHKTGGEK